MLRVSSKSGIIAKQRDGDAAILSLVGESYNDLLAKVDVPDSERDYLTSMANAVVIGKGLWYWEPTSRLPIHILDTPEVGGHSG